MSSTDRAAILARRAALIASAMAAVTGCRPNAASSETDAAQLAARNGASTSEAILTPDAGASAAATSNQETLFIPLDASAPSGSAKTKTRPATVRVVPNPNPMPMACLSVLKPRE